ncbi:dephospho-CoA kinase [Waterburya agarophytonicola K14]|uniref:Dephospho-CoA kinase n=1 Tax=Waterburya agarophytonicola KI4 TaxID=2874699 RepID=A0A964BUK7_9CYAN|nr:dephospho-CoA kinase [Waterburya agarophytonicola]MCC0178793.1 dephospho-CoA kinase [Waterburya agarophytonicola KI4]
MNQRLIGLTGGIATGKTTVSNYLAEKYSLPILDADVYAREAVAPDSPILQIIFTRYGDRVILPDRTLNRAALGEIIFNSHSEKQWLESQIHPYVRDRFDLELQTIRDHTIILDIPLLFEANLTNTVTEIWVVSCDHSMQVARLQQRNGLTVKQAEARIDSQLPLVQKVAAADVVLENNGDLDDLFAEVDREIHNIISSKFR